MLALTRATLAKHSQPKASYDVNATLVKDDAEVRLGDTVAAIDTSRDPEWRLKARVVKRVRTFSDAVQVRMALATVQQASYSATNSLMERVTVVEDTADAATDTVAAVSEAVTVDSATGEVKAIATRQHVDDAIAALDDLSGLDF